MEGARQAQICWLGVLALAGCGYSEDEWRGKLREIESLQAQLTAEEAESTRAQRELDEARAKVEQMKDQLAAAGVDVANLRTNIEEQARALEEYKQRALQLEQIKRRFEVLQSKLEQLTELGLKVVVRNNRMVIELPGDVLFESGRETLSAQGQEILTKVAAIIRGDEALNQRDFQVAGHTDNRPYRTGLFKDNWGLSVMRAREVLAFLVDPKNGGLEASHWSAAGYGDLEPVDSNDTPEGRQANRRCELVVLPNVEEMLDLRKLAQ
jgi:chemotaxis protein MotB